MSVQDGAVVRDATAMETKDRAASTVEAYRGVDWKGVERGDARAVQDLLAACQLHDDTVHFLEREGGELGERLVSGLDRFWSREVGPRLGSPGVLERLAADASGRGEELKPRKRPTVTTGHTVRMTTGCGNLYVTINETEDGRPFELFNHMGKAGGCAASQNEAIGRLISYAMRCGASLEPLIKQIKGISCHRPAWSEDGKISSCSDAIGKALEKYCAAHPPAAVTLAPGRGNGNGKSRALDARAAALAAPARALDSGGPVPRSDSHRVQGACLDCGGQLAFEEGCVKCYSCGFTECS